MFKLIDVHCHLQFSAFDKDREEVIKRVLKDNIGIINVGADKKTSEKAVELAEKHSGFWATVGQHPSELDDFDYEFYKNLANNEKVVAIGECGLDFYRISNLKSQISKIQIKKQKEVFIKHIELAKEIKKPLMIHCRDASSTGSEQAFNDLIEILITNYQLLITPNPGVIHFFTGTLETAKKLLAMGFYFTFGGLITFNRDFDEIIKFIPLEKIMLETDAPYVAPAPYRGKRNEPLYIIETAKKLAEIKGVSLEETAKQTAENAKVVFRLKI